jgi:hypothetical protein
MWRASTPKTLRSLALQFCVTAIAALIVWLILGRGVGVLIAFVAINLVGVVIQALNLKTGDRPDQAAIPEIFRARARRKERASAE